MKITIPELSLVVLVGASGSGKSTFARKHFKPTEVLSSDYFRALVADDEASQEATQDAFDTLHYVTAKRLSRRRLTVIDATNVQPDARKPLLDLARRYHYLTTAIVLDVPVDVCHARNQARPERDFGPHVVRTHVRLLRQALRLLQREGFGAVHVLSGVAEIDAAVVERVPLWTDRRGETGPFDIVGDVHGCFDELVQLLTQLGYAETDGVWKHPKGRKVVFVGDLVDRGPRITDVLRLAMAMIDAGQALCVCGNHDDKLARHLRGSKVKIAHGLQLTLDQLAAESEEFIKRVASFVNGLRSHYVLDAGRLVVAHGGLTEELQGRASGRVRSFALYGDTTGETDEFGLPVRLNWAAEYRGKAVVVYGHTPVPEADWLNNTINIDTGCVFGGKLTALRYPERELVSVPAAREYSEPARPLKPAPAPAPADDLLDLDDVIGKRIVETRLHGRLTVREEQARAALEVMSRFALDPRWLIYLPPTMSPPETSRLPGLLEHPAEAFLHYADRGIKQVVCQEKHMGSRAVLVICRDAQSALRRFGIDDPLAGACWTRTGRRFFDAAALEAELFGVVRSALDRAGFWERFRSDWFALDCELMPWSAKAQALLRQQYAAVGCSARAALVGAVSALRPAGDADLLARFEEKAINAEAFTAAYRRYCWPVASVADLKLAPFHLLASEGAVHVDRDHTWHMETLAELCRAAEGVLLATPFRLVDLSSESSRADGSRWWEELTGRGGEGMVVKPIDFIPTANGRERAQPAVKCRGREYLRIIYGPDYTMPEHLSRLRERGLGHKRSLASREFALGIESLERFVRREPLRRVHECVFALLALESDPVDPRL